MAQLITYLGTWQTQVIVILIAIDVLLGIIAALYRKEFVFGKLVNFMKAPVLGYVFGFAVLQAVGMALPNLAFLIPIAFALIVIGLIASIFRNLGKLGIPVPSDLKK